MPEDRRHLQRHGNQWRVRIKVPERLREVVGSKVLIQPLHVSSLAAANLLKGEHVSAFKARLSEARKILGLCDPVEAEALTTRSYMANRKTVTLKDIQHPDGFEEVYDPEETGIEERAYQIAEEHGGKQAKTYYDLAMGKHTLLDQYAEIFLSQTDYRDKSKGELERALRWLKEWMKTNELPPVIETIDKKIAGRFVDEFLIKGRTKKTASKSLSFIRSYWEWLSSRGIEANEDAWTSKRLVTKGKNRSKAKARAYTDSELVTLLSTPHSSKLYDLMMIGILSGMRLEEICQLTLSDCQEGFFSIIEGKTVNAIRRIPIHSALEGIVAVRLEGKAPGDYLFHELGETAPSRQEDNHRSDPLGKAFNRYRRGVCGIDERPNGQRRSNVTFHSFRNTFIQKASHGLNKPDAGYNPWTIAKLVGHDTGGVIDALKLTMHGYAGDDSDDALRACVEAVRIPALR